MAIPPLRRWVNKRIIRRAAMRARTRPHIFSSMPVKGDTLNKDVAGYTSWESLTDRNWFSRHLPPPSALPTYRPLNDMAQLFQVQNNMPVLSEDSTVLFLSFAQWFTDSFLMTDRQDRRRTHTSHQIDLSPLYGLTREQTQALRVMSNTPGERGRLKCENLGGAIYAPKLYDQTGVVKPEFQVLRPPLGLEEQLSALPPAEAARRRAAIFAFGGERSNSTPYTSMLSTLFLREHNRLAKDLDDDNEDWDDERVFQTARNINVVQLIKIVVEDYVNHISPYHFQLSADPSVCWHETWNKPNWIPIEFDLLYRWHSLVPETFDMGNRVVVPVQEALFDNTHLIRVGLAPLAELASRQQAREIGLLNTIPALIHIELDGLKQCRENKIGSYNDYREAFGYPRVRKFEQITGKQERIDMLRQLYGNNPDNVEYFVGLFAEDVPRRAAVPPLIGRMVALDAFTQALTNPLMSEHVFNERTFTDYGMRQIRSTKRLQDIVNRNRAPNENEAHVSMTYT
jgi:prostaglandin-endoperoxide synthase 2